MRRLAAVVLSVAALAASALIAATPARADWANTRWGMSRAEIQALYPDAAPSPDGKLISSAPVEFDGVRGRHTEFVFDSEGLGVVVVMTDASYEDLWSALTSRYGAAVSAHGRPGDGLRLADFKAAGTGERVWITQVAGTRSVSWTHPPRAEPGA